MKKIFGLLLGTVIFNASAIAVQAQSSDPCYMLDAHGNAINLGYLCQKSDYSPPLNRPTRNYSNNDPDETQTFKRKGVYVIPIKSRSFGVPVVEVKFNNKYTFEMLLDTGASGVYITRQMANKLDINYTGTQLISTASNQIVVPSGHFYSVGVGEITKKNVAIATLPSMDIGLLGQSFFGNYDVTIKSDVVEFRAR